MLTGIPAAHGEAFNILRYENDQHYDSHYDAFDEESYGKQHSQRVRGATVMQAGAGYQGCFLRCVWGGGGGNCSVLCWGIAGCMAWFPGFAMF